MRPLHIAALVAVALVGVMLWLLREDETRRAATGSTDTSARAGRAQGGGAAGMEGVGDAAGSAASSEVEGIVTLRIVDEAGNPSDGAQIELLGPLEARYSADRDGRVAMPELPVGCYDLLAQRGEARGGLSFLRGSAGALDLGTLTVRAAVRVSGHVFGAGGRRLEGARVEAVQASDEGPIHDAAGMVRRMVESDTVLAATTCAEDGAYTLLVPRGIELSVRASARGLAPEHEPARAWNSSVDGLDFVLGVGTRMSGIVLDPGEHPVAGARVMLNGIESLLVGAAPKSTTFTGPDGRFDVAAAEEDNLVLVVRVPGYALHVQPGTGAGEEVTVHLRPVTSARLRVVLEEGGAPVAGVQAMIATQTVFGAAATDADGRAVLELMRMEERTGDDGDWNVALTGGGIDPVTRQATATWDESGCVADLGTLEVAPGGVCRGRVLDAVSGEPIASARVRSFGGSDPFLLAWGGGEAVTGEDGAYELTGVPLAATLIHAAHPDYVDDLNPLEHVFGGGGDAEPIFPPGATETRVDVRLQPAATISGTVVDGEGNPVAGARVEPESDDNAATFAVIVGGAAQHVFTDANGRFALGGRSPGSEVMLKVRHRDYAASAAVRATAPCEGLRITLEGGVRVTGSVTDAAGEPIPGVRVVLLTEAAEEPGLVATSASGDRPIMTRRAARPALTDEAGTFVLRNVPPGDCEISLSHPDYLDLRAPLHVPAGEELVEPPPYRMDAGLSIEGIVVDVEGKPLDGAPVVGTLQGEKRFQQRTTKAGPDGRFVLRGLPDGSWQLDVRREESITDRPVVPAGAAGVVVNVRASASLSGIVTAAEGPVEDARIRVRPQSAGDQDWEANAWGRTDSHGQFEVRGLDPALTYDVWVGHDGFRTVRRGGLRPGGSPERFTLEPGLEVAGVVVDESGAPVAGALVYLRAPDNEEQLEDPFSFGGNSTQTDEHGRFRLGGLAPGRFQVGVHVDDAPWVPGPIVDAGTKDVRVVVRKGVSLKGRIVAASGAVPQQILIEVLGEGDEPLWAQIVVNPEGRFTVSGLEPGSYRLRVAPFDGGGADSSKARTFGPYPVGSTGLVLTVDW